MTCPYWMRRRKSHLSPTRSGSPFGPGVDWLQILKLRLNAPSIRLQNVPLRGGRGHSLPPKIPTSRRPLLSDLPGVYLLRQFCL